jgi:hypothetical protein
MYSDISGYAREHWYIAVGIVAVLAIATVITCGGAGIAFAAIGLASQGVAMAGISTAATVFAFATAGSAGALAAAGMYSAMSSSSVEEFDDSGGTALVMTATGGLVGGYIGYLNRPITSHLFPNNPDDFNPNGLTRHPYKNGEILKWQETNIDGSRGKAIFEWNYDAGPNGSHYHITPNGVDRIIHPFTGNTHMYPGDMIPYDFWGYFN